MYRKKMYCRLQPLQVDVSKLYTTENGLVGDLFLTTEDCLHSFNFNLIQQSNRTFILVSSLDFFFIFDSL